MNDRLELLDRSAAHALRGGVRIEVLRMLCLQLLQAPHHLIEVVVGDLRPSVVIQTVVPLQLAAEILDFYLRFHRRSSRLTGNSSWKSCGTGLVWRRQSCLRWQTGLSAPHRARRP